MKPTPTCSPCNDTGIIRVDGKHQYCTCAFGCRLRTDAGGKAESWLERMDASIAKKPEAGSSRGLAELEAEYYFPRPLATQDGEL